MSHDAGERAELRALAEGADWAPMGTSGGEADWEAASAPGPERENPRGGGGFPEAADGIRTHDLLHGKQTL